jgi:hypothetical protein
MQRHQVHSRSAVGLGILLLQLAGDHVHRGLGLLERDAIA